MLPPINLHMCTREASTTPDSSRLQTFRHLGDCLRSESSCCKSRHTCCSRHLAFEWSIRTRHQQRALTWSTRADYVDFEGHWEVTQKTSRWGSVRLLYVDRSKWQEGHARVQIIQVGLCLIQLTTEYFGRVFHGHCFQCSWSMWAPMCCWIFDSSQDSPHTSHLKRPDVEEPPALAAAGGPKILDGSDDGWVPSATTARTCTYFGRQGSDEQKAVVVSQHCTAAPYKEFINARLNVSEVNFVTNRTSTSGLNRVAEARSSSLEERRRSGLIRLKPRSTTSNLVRRGGGEVGVWGPLGGLGIGVRKKYSVYLSNLKHIRAAGVFGSSGFWGFLDIVRRTNSRIQWTSLADIQDRFRTCPERDWIPFLFGSGGTKHFPKEWKSRDLCLFTISCLIWTCKHSEPVIFVQS